MFHRSNSFIKWTATCDWSYRILSGLRYKYESSWPRSSIQYQETEVSTRENIGTQKRAVTKDWMT